MPADILDNCIEFDVGGDLKKVQRRDVVKAPLENTICRYDNSRNACGRLYIVFLWLYYAGSCCHDDKIVGFSAITTRTLAFQPFSFLFECE